MVAIHLCEVGPDGPDPRLSFVPSHFLVLKPKERERKGFWKWKVVNGGSSHWGVTLAGGTHCCQRAIPAPWRVLPGTGAGASLRPGPVAGGQGLRGPRFSVSTLVQSCHPPCPGREAFILSPGQWLRTRTSI